MIFDIKGKVIIVTGSNSGIGLTISNYLIGCGVSVIRIDRKFSKADSKLYSKKNATIYDIKANLADVKKIPKILKK